MCSRLIVCLLTSAECKAVVVRVQMRFRLVSCPCMQLSSEAQSCERSQPNSQLPAQYDTA